MPETKALYVRDYLGTFFWDFKRMDNTVYNFSVLKELYEGKEKSFRANLYIKPIISESMAIIECIVFDFMKRINEHTREKIPRLSEEVIQNIKNEKMWHKKSLNLNDFLPVLKEYNLLNLTIKGTFLYDNLVSLNKIRNRIHIQNEYRHTPLNEKDIFKESVLKSVEFTLEIVLIAMMKFYRRPWEDEIDYKTFPYSWK
jgi:hypothetical protein